MIEANKKEEPKLSCDICKHKLKTEKALAKHMTTKHEGYTKCESCKKSFKNIEALKTHIKNVHCKNRKENIDDKLTEEVMADLEKYNFGSDRDLTPEEEADLEQYNF